MTPAADTSCHRTLWKSLFLLCIACSIAGESLAVPAINPQSRSGIIFPAVEQFEACFVDAQQTVRGSCKPLSECRSALDRWKYENIRPQTCYFNKFDHIVCCEKHQQQKQQQQEQEPERERAQEPVSVSEPAPTAFPHDPEVYTPKPDVQRHSETECDTYYGPKIFVVNGLPTKPKEFPYMAALGWKSLFDNTTYYRCGGVLISKKFVLTAAHCAKLGGAPPDEVRLGGVNLTDPDVRNVRVKTAFIYPSYNVTAYYDDIALLELEHDVADMPVCVWSEENVPHSNVTAIGYGHTRFAGSGSDYLLKAPLFVIPNNICEQFYGIDPQNLYRGVSSTQICAGDPKHRHDTCQGDSGGPIILHVSKEVRYNYVVGITSFGEGCAGAPPSVYTRPSAYIDWVESIVWPAPRPKNRK